MCLCPSEPDLLDEFRQFLIGNIRDVYSNLLAEFFEIYGRTLGLIDWVCSLGSSFRENLRKISCRRISCSLSLCVILISSIGFIP